MTTAVVMAYSLTERLARGAIDAGAGFEARFMAAETAHLQGRSGQAEQELAALAVRATSGAEKARVALLRFDNVYWKHSADFQIIDDALADITDPFWRDGLVNRRLFATAMSSGPRERLEAASTWIQRLDSASRYAVLQASIRMGHLDEAIEQLTPPRIPERSLRPTSRGISGCCSAFALPRSSTPAVSARRTSFSLRRIATSWIIRRPKRELSLPTASPSSISSRAAR